MRQRANTKGVYTVAKYIAPETARLILGMRRRGDTFDEISTYLGMSRRQIEKVVHRHRPEYVVEPLPRNELPPPPPYKVVSASVIDQLRESAAIPMSLLAEIRDRLRKIEDAVQARDTERENTCSH